MVVTRVQVDKSLALLWQVCCWEAVSLHCHIYGDLVLIAAGMTVGLGAGENSPKCHRFARYKAGSLRVELLSGHHHFINIIYQCFLKLYFDSG